MMLHVQLRKHILALPRSPFGREGQGACGGGLKSLGRLDFVAERLGRSLVEFQI